MRNVFGTSSLLTKKQSTILNLICAGLTIILLGIYLTNYHFKQINDMKSNYYAQKSYEVYNNEFIPLLSSSTKDFDHFNSKTKNDELEICIAKINTYTLLSDDYRLRRVLRSTNIERHGSGISYDDKSTLSKHVYKIMNKLKSLEENDSSGNLLSKELKDERFLLIREYTIFFNEAYEESRLNSDVSYIDLVLFQR